MKKIKKILLTFVLLLYTSYSFYFNSFNKKIIEKDCAFSGTDYIESEMRRTLVMSSSTYSSNIDTYTNFKNSFFDNLTYNFGMNYKGSCGYVAIAMLLSYYDTFLTDNIIPEQYDINSFGDSTNMILRRNSPGVLKDIISDPSNSSNFNYGFNLSASEYFSAISSLQTSSLHAKLITIGAARGYYDFSDNNNPCATNFNNRYNVINDYFSNIVGYSLNDDYSILSYNGESSSSLSDNVRNFAIEQISLGNPVLLSISGNIGGHVVVAYDYDSDEDKLYCHMGWNASSTHVTIEENSFSRYKTALAINFNINHSHTNNYAVTTVVDNIPSSNFYCYKDCQISTISSVNSHNYTDHYSMYNASKHKAYCHCDAYVLRPHAILAGSTYILNGHTYGNCVECGTLIDLGTTNIINSRTLDCTTLITSNSSYVMTNGIVIIANDDLENYFSFTS